MSVILMPAYMQYFDSLWNVKVHLVFAPKGHVLLKYSSF